MKAIKQSNKNKLRFTTVALDNNQYIVRQGAQYNIAETYCIGYTNGKRDKKLDGYYFNVDLKPKP